MEISLSLGEMKIASSAYKNPESDGAVSWASKVTQICCHIEHALDRVDCQNEEEVGKWVSLLQPPSMLDGCSRDALSSTLEEAEARSADSQFVHLGGKPLLEKVKQVIPSDCVKSLCYIQLET